MDYLIDYRGNCMSVIFTVLFSQYEALINCAYKNRGGIEGQRGALKSSTAIRIRKRMIDDISSGTVLPPVVIGAAIEGVNYQEFSKKDENELVQWLISNAEDLSLIDGMQRTTAMLEAAKSSDLSNYRIRVELWLAQNVNNLRLDFLDLTSNNDSTHQFTEALSLMSRLDSCFTRVTAAPEGDKERFLNGIDIFSSQPACVGFMASTAILMLGRPGNTQSKEVLEEKWHTYRETFEKLLTQMESMPVEKLEQFLALLRKGISLPYQYRVV